MEAETALDVPGKTTSELQAWRTGVLNILLLIVAIVALPATGSIVINAIGDPRQRSAAVVFIACYLLVVGLAGFRRLDTRLRAWGILLIACAAGVLAFIRGGLAGDGRVYLMALPVLAFILIGVRSGLAMTILSLVIYGSFTLLAYLGRLDAWLVVRDNPVTLPLWTDAGLGVVMMLIPLVVLLWQFIQFQEKILATEHRTATKLAQTSTLLREQVKEHEDANRTLTEQAKALSTAAEVARQTTSLTDEQALIERFVNLIAERFDLSHAGIFLSDAQGQGVVLRAASSEEGKRMVSQGYRVQVGSDSPVGQTAQSGKAILSPTLVTAALPNSPSTQWQATLPLQAGTKIIGVLDVHFQGESSPSEKQVQVLQTLVDQLTIGLENARLFAQTQLSLDELNQLHQMMTGEAWRQFTKARPDLRCYQVGARVPDETWNLLFDQAKSQEKPAVICTGDKDGTQHALAVPIKLRGVPIGTLGLYRPAGAGEWRPEEITLAEEIAGRSALALESAHLLEESRRSAARERLTGEIATHLRETPDVETILKTAIQEMRRALKLPEIVVRLTPSALMPQGDGQSESKEALA